MNAYWSNYTHGLPKQTNSLPMFYTGGMFGVVFCFQTQRMPIGPVTPMDLRNKQNDHPSFILWYITDGYY